jgi:hypothetical protein
MAKITARLARIDHPNGQTVRGGVVWTREWQTADLDRAAIAAVKADVNIETRRKAAEVAPADADAAVVPAAEDEGAAPVEGDPADADA